MKKIKEPSVANIFYSGDADTLKNQLRQFANVSNRKCEYKLRAVIVPHAGLVYSGQLAYDGINLLDKNIKNIFIFAPAHRVSFDGLSLSTFDEWKTPLGNIAVNQDINKDLESNFGAKFFDEAYAEEHSVEIQVPLIQDIFEEVKIIPVLVGKTSPQVITEIIEKYYSDKDFGFIISSDLSHFLNDESAKKIDNVTANMIETGNIDGFKFEQACGALGIYAITEFANKNGYSFIRRNMMNSSAVSGDKNRVVGYGVWFLYEGLKNKFIKEYYSDYLINLCKDVLSSKFENHKVYTNHDSVFDEMGACFVTLKKNGYLRGCIGSIIAHQPLIYDVVQHAQDAAFRDSRFNPVSQDELDDLSIDISLLSDPKRMNFKGEEDLLNQIVMYKDGIIIKDGNYQAVYLPSVWEDLPDKKMFLNSLKQKAGLPANYFSDRFEAYRFETEMVEQDSL